jgi:hypothetical protein
MDRHIIDALFGLLLDNFEHHLARQVFHPPHARQRLVDRHRADRHWRFVDDRLPDARNVAARRKVHHGIGAVLDAILQLGQFFGDIGCGRRVADIRVDLALRRHTDAHRLQARMTDIGGDHHPSACHLVANQLRGDVLPLCHMLHFFSDHALPGIVHLRANRIFVTVFEPV